MNARMNARTNDVASYVAVGNRVGINGAGLALNAAYDRLRTDKQRLEATFAGAVLALLLKENPWLASFRLSLSADIAYDDAGRYYRSIDAQVNAVRQRDGAALPEELARCGQDALDEEAAEDRLAWALQEDADEIYSGLAGGEDCYDTVNFEIRRAALGDLLERDSIDGREAFVRLFPEQRSLVEEASDE
jgi:hypothetical protein